MSETPAADAPAATLPPLYRRPEVLRLDRHGKAGLRPLSGYGFAAGLTAVPLNVAEFGRAAVSFPIVFGGRETLSPVAIVGVRREQNLFVHPDGAWEPDTHVPAYLARFPYILTRAEDDPDRVLLCIEAESDRIAPEAAAEEGAAPFFEGSEPAAEAKRGLQLCLDWQRQAQVTEAAVKALREAEVLVPREGRVDLPGGETLRLTDFHVVDEAALNKLPDEAFLKLRATGALAAAYCQLASQQTWPRLIRLANARK